MRQPARLSLVFAALTLSLAARIAPAAVRDFAYLSPVPGSRLVSPQNNVALRLGTPLEASSVSAALLSVTGSRSGAHAGQLQLTADGLTLVFRPAQPFATGETVRVRLSAGARTRAGAGVPALDYTFQVSSVRASEMPRPEPEFAPAPAAQGAWWNEPAPSPATAAGPCDPSLPDFPLFSLVDQNAQIEGAYFMAPFISGAGTSALLQIMDDQGQPLFQRVFDNRFGPTDFKLQQGRLTFFLGGPERFFAMDSSFAVVDSFACGNGYATDLHDLQLLPDGHALLMSYDPEPVDMSQVVPGGNPNAIVVGLIVQELDENKDVVFQWRSWDHFAITDCSVNSINNINLTGPSIDYVHGNSLQKTPDGNLLISCRHMNELTKIDRSTGAILWRMGRNAVNNQWSFPNDTRGWSEQHDARILPNGHLTVFDNGNGSNPLYSRALEFELDEANKVATKVWEYRSTPDIFAGFMGDVQRHADGSTTIGWGGWGGTIKSTDLLADGTTIASQIQGPAVQVNYRSFRMPWRTTRIMTSVEDLTLAAPTVNVGVSDTIRVWNHSNQGLDITCLRTVHPYFGAELAGGSLPVHLEPGETTSVSVTYAPFGALPVDSRLYIMQVREGESVAQTVELHGHVDGPVGVPPAPGAALGASARPNPLRLRTTIDYTVPSPGRVTLSVFDVRGRRLATLVDGVLPAGRHSVEWVAPRGGGLYFCRLQAAGRRVVEKLVVTGR